MEKIHKRFIAGGTCAMVLCGAMLGAASDDESSSMTIDCQQVMYRESVSEEIDAPESSADKDGIFVTFTAEPVKEENGMAVFRYDSEITVLTDLEGLTIGEPVEVNGTIKEISDSQMILIDCIVCDQTSNAAVSETPPENSSISAAATTAVNAGNNTVYVSSSGKYHRKSDCSGMKSYEAMSLTEATEHGYVACKRCY